VCVVGESFVNNKFLGSIHRASFEFNLVSPSKALHCSISFTEYDSVLWDPSTAAAYRTRAGEGPEENVSLPLANIEAARPPRDHCPKILVYVNVPSDTRRMFSFTI